MFEMLKNKKSERQISYISSLLYQWITFLKRSTFYFVRVSKSTLTSLLLVVRNSRNFYECQILFRITLFKNLNDSIPLRVTI